MHSVILSELAGEKLDLVLDYLIEEWSQRSSDNFYEKFEEKLKHIALFPESCIKSKKHFIFVLLKQTSFLYRILKERIEVITVFDNRSSNKSIRKEIRKYYGHI